MSLRFGRRIAHDIHTTMAAYVPETNDLVAIVERAKRGETKPVGSSTKQSRPACTQYEHDKTHGQYARRRHMKTITLYPPMPAAWWIGRP